MKADAPQRRYVALFARYVARVRRASPTYVVPAFGSSAPCRGTRIFPSGSGPQPAPAVIDSRKGRGRRSKTEVHSDAVLIRAREGE
eukprot:4480595-Pleurochrysis_carterae.AAC.1